VVVLSAGGGGFVCGVIVKGYCAAMAGRRARGGGRKPRAQISLAQSLQAGQRSNPCRRSCGYILGASGGAQQELARQHHPVESVRTAGRAAAVEGCLALLEDHRLLTEGARKRTKTPTTFLSR
jgi:threonine dehydratase